MGIFVVINERCFYWLPPYTSGTLKREYPTFQLHTTCLAATHGATVSTDENAAKIPHHRGGEDPGDGGAISICRQGKGGTLPMRRKDRES